MPIAVVFSILLAFSIDIALPLPPVLPLLADKHLQVLGLVQLLIAL